MIVGIEIEGIDELYEELINAPRKAEIALARVLNFVVQSAAQRARHRIRSGGRSGNVYVFGGTTHVASAPGEPPANLSGALASSIRFTKATDREGSSASVGSDLDYAATLENGGWAEGNFGVVYVEPRPFLLPSFEEAVAEGLKKFKSEFEKEFRK